MWKSYLISPTSLAEHFAFYREQFGHAEGRLIHTLESPNAWLQAVKAELLRHQKLTPIEERRLEVNLQQLKGACIEHPFVTYQHNPTLPYQQSAALYQPALPLDAQIDPTSASQPTLKFSDTTHWKAPHAQWFPLNPKHWQNLLTSMLCMDQTIDTIKIIDPYFKLHEPSGHTILTLIEQALRLAPRPLKLQIHLGPPALKDNGDKNDPWHFTDPPTNWGSRTKQWAKAIHESTLRETLVEVVVVAKTSGAGLQFHDRYLLTNKNGIAIGQGIEVHETRQGSKTTSIHRLSNEMHRELYSAFQNTSTPQFKVLKTYTLNLTHLKRSKNLTP